MEFIFGVIAFAVVVWLAIALPKTVAYHRRVMAAREFIRGLEGALDEIVQFRRIAEEPEQAIGRLTR